jgi:hypothetical protein
MLYETRSAVVSLLFCLAMTSLGSAQYLDRRTHLAPPMGAFQSEDLEAWDSLGCRVSIFTMDGKPRYFQYTLSRERMEKTPSWDATELDPNLSPGVALRLARRQFESLKPYGDCEYKYELQLQSYWGKWLWAVIFTPVSAKLRTEQGFPVFVLMDGGTLKSTEVTPDYLKK